MEIKKLSFLGVIFAAVLLASCAGTEEVDGSADSSTGSTGSTSSAVAPAVTETVDSAAAALQNITTVYYFGFDEATLTDESRANLDVAAAALKLAGVSVRLEGHADERGTPEYNLALGERRAQSVANYLTLQGVDASKLEVISYGEEKPVLTGSDEASWAKNRRVELVK